MTHVSCDRRNYTDHSCLLAFLFVHVEDLWIKTREDIVLSISYRHRNKRQIYQDHNLSGDIRIILGLKGW